MLKYTEPPKAPRWISTEAGNWAWHSLEAWRKQATNALTVQERRDLLNEAEELRQESAREARSTSF